MPLHPGLAARLTLESARGVGAPVITCAIGQSHRAAGGGDGWSAYRYRRNRERRHSHGRRLRNPIEVRVWSRREGAERYAGWGRHRAHRRWSRAARGRLPETQRGNRDEGNERERDYPRAPFHIRPPGGLAVEIQ